MSDFLLVHGSAHGAWCWRDLIPSIVAEHHRIFPLSAGVGHDFDLALHAIFRGWAGKFCCFNAQFCGRFHRPIIGLVKDQNA